MPSLLAVACVLSLALVVAACKSSGGGVNIQTREVVYEAGSTKLHGYVARDTTATGKRPGVLVIHEWWGHNDYVRGRARQLAELGYVALAVDMYGEGRQADHPENATAFMQEVMGNRENLEGRFRAALEVLKQQDGVDPEKVAAIGYCMGGAIALEMAREGCDLDAVVSFHGALATESPAQKGVVKPRILVCTGAADPFVPAEQVQAFRDEMKNAGANCDVVAYADVVHAFTNPGATAKGEKFELPLKYDETADRDSWDRMKALFTEVFGG